MTTPVSPPGVAHRSMQGKTVLITGPTQGIGKETASALAGLGATVIMAARNIPLANQVADEIRARHQGADVIIGPRLDLSSQSSVKDFAEEYKEKGWPLHVLINNAGAYYEGEPWFTDENIGGICQVNHLGGYTLTRLLEDKIIETGPGGRIVNLSSVTHRLGFIGDVDTFLQSWKRGSNYGNTKLCNALTAIELTRRFPAEYGIQACAVDPGGVASSIWSTSIFAKPPLKWAIDALFAPNSDGAKAVVHAATVDWEQEREKANSINQSWLRSVDADPDNYSTGKWSKNSKNTSAGLLERDIQAVDGNFRFYARGLFSWPTVTSLRGKVDPGTMTDLARQAVYGVSALWHSALDWPIRRISGGRLGGTTNVVPAAPLVYDRELSKRLWEVSANAAGVSPEIRVKIGRGEKRRVEAVAIKARTTV